MMQDVWHRIGRGISTYMLDRELKKYHKRTLANALANALGEGYRIVMRDSEKPYEARTLNPDGKRLLLLKMENDGVTNLGDLLPFLDEEGQKYIAKMHKLDEKLAGLKRASGSEASRG